jgi:hypothetical protein
MWASCFSHPNAESVEITAVSSMPSLMSGFGAKCTEAQDVTTWLQEKFGFRLTGDGNPGLCDHPACQNGSSAKEDHVLFSHFFHQWHSAWFRATTKHGFDKWVVLLDYQVIWPRENGPSSLSWWSGGSQSLLPSPSPSSRSQQAAWCSCWTRTLMHTKATFT